MFLLIAYAENYSIVTIPSQFSEKTYSATAFYLSGYLLKRMQLSYNHFFVKGIGLLIIPAIASSFLEMNVALNKGWQVFTFYPIAISGTLGILLLCQGLNKYSFSERLAYVGSKTLYILTFHYLAFKLISYMYIKINGMPIGELTSFPILESVNSWMWIIYTIIGVSIPLLFESLKTKIQSLWD